MTAKELPHTHTGYREFTRSAVDQQLACKILPYALPFILTQRVFFTIFIYFKDGVIKT